MIPVSIITGFLGSGKTTLLRRLLADPRMGMTAVLINEFGEVGIDHLLLRKVDEDIVLLNSGCLCCNLRDDLIETLDDLRGKRQWGSIPAFERVVLETTGLADPAPIIHTFVTNQNLTSTYSLKVMVTTVDATHGDDQLDNFPEALKQVVLADRLVITKTDLIDPGGLMRLRSRLSELCPAVVIFEAKLNSGPGPDELFKSDPFSIDGKIADAQRWLSEVDEEALPRHADGSTTHDDRLSSFCLTADDALDWTTFTQWLAVLLANRGDQLLRIKGLLNVIDRTRPVVIHGVQHVFYPPTELDEWPDGDRRSRVVFITRDLPRSAVERAFERLTSGRLLHPPGSSSRVQ
jgi:G3E family GTPase